MACFQCPPGWRETLINIFWEQFFNHLVIHPVKSDTLFIDSIIVFENAFTYKSFKHVFKRLAILNICNRFWYNMGHTQTKINFFEIELS